MLQPDSRTVAMDLLRPPEGYHLDQAILTTFSLDLEALLALPLAVLAHSDGGVQELLQDPLLVLEALREAGKRIHVFCDEERIAIPNKARELYALLEPSVHPVRAPNGGAFHPKVWVARFVDDGDPDKDDEPLYRVAVLSRNLTFDRSWDIALASESHCRHGKVAASKGLGELVAALPGLSSLGLDKDIRDLCAEMADEVSRTKFAAPAGFDGKPIKFKSFGLGKKARPWKPVVQSRMTLAVAPFVNKTALAVLGELTWKSGTLVSRQSELDALDDETLAQWDRVYVLADAAEGETEDEEAGQPSGLHAKFIALEDGWDVTWFVGSANLTAAAFTGTNVELMASIKGRKGKAGGKSGFGIDRFMESGFQKMCAKYHRGEASEVDAAATAATKSLEHMRERIVEAKLEISCAPAGDSWKWILGGKLEMDAGVAVHVWPVSLEEERAQALALPLTLQLPEARLSAFVAFRLSSEVKGADDVRFILKLPASGMPDERISQVLRTLINSPERFLRFLRALLGGLEGMVDLGGGDKGGGDGAWGQGFSADTLLEDLVRAAARDPARLAPVRRLIEDLRSTPEGIEVVPDALYELWKVIDESVRPQREATP